MTWSQQYTNQLNSPGAARTEDLGETAEGFERRGLLPATQNAELETQEQTVAPAFNAHLVAAQNLLDKLPK